MGHTWVTTDECLNYTFSFTLNLMVLHILSDFSGFGYDDDAWVKWTTDHKFAAVDNTLDNELIPYLTKQGMNLKLGG